MDDRGAAYTRSELALCASESQRAKLNDPTVMGQIRAAAREGLEFHLSFNTQVMSFATPQERAEYQKAHPHVLWHIHCSVGFEAPSTGEYLVHSRVEDGSGVSRVLVDGRVVSEVGVAADDSSGPTLEARYLAALQCSPGEIEQAISNSDAPMEVGVALRDPVITNAIVVASLTSDEGLLRLAFDRAPAGDRVKILETLVNSEIWIPAPDHGAAV